MNSVWGTGFESRSSISCRAPHWTVVALRYLVIMVLVLIAYLVWFYIPAGRGQQKKKKVPMQSLILRCDGAQLNQGNRRKECICTHV